MLDWLPSDLSGRYQFVRVVYMSNPLRKVFRPRRERVNGGVPQGSVLGRIPFVVSINNLTKGHPLDHLR